MIIKNAICPRCKKLNPPMNMQVSKTGAREDVIYHYNCTRCGCMYEEKTFEEKEGKKDASK